jgi:transcriptional regulator with XRE-family HTH domain
VTSRKRLLAKLKNKAYREAYTAEHVKTTTPLQIRTVRGQREWTQGKLAVEAKTTQTAISRMEDPNYGNLTLNNLLKIAAALDVGLLVKLVPFSRLVQEFEDLSPEAMSASSFIEDWSALAAWADSTSEVGTTDPESLHPSVLVTFSVVHHQQEDNHPLRLPALGESFELNFPEVAPLIAQDNMADTSIPIVTNLKYSLKLVGGYP